MLRKSLLLLPVLVPGLLAVPVLTPAHAAPRPVEPSVQELALDGVDPAAAGRLALRREGEADGGTGPVVLTEPRDTRRFEVLGVTWQDGEVGDLAVSVRTRSAGVWSGWTPLEVEEELVPDGGEARGTRPGTEPLWVGESDGVQARVDVLRGAAPSDVRLALVDPGESPADASAASASQPASTAHASTLEPQVRPRSAWGADESIRRGTPAYASRLRGVTLHHTASSSSYAAADVPALLRGFYAYHVKSQGWSDLGYNFLVDRFGTIWEGRAGGTSRNVIGSHAGGFNTGTVGIAMIGTYETLAPSASMREGVAQVAAWRMWLARLDPRGTVQLTSQGSTKFKSGTAVSLPTVFGHGQVSATSCPGTQGYAALPGLRNRMASLLAGAPPLPPQPEPEPEPAAAAPLAAGGLHVVAPPTAAAGGQVDVTVHGTPGRPVELWFARLAGEGTASAGATRRRSESFGDDGTYRTTYVADADYALFAVSDGRGSARTVVRTSPPTADGAAVPALGISGPVTVEAHVPALVTVTGPAGAAVAVWFRTHGEQTWVRRREGRLGGDGTWTTTFTTDKAHDYFAMSSTVASADATTVIGAVPNGLHVHAPATAVGGHPVDIVVQGRAGAPVAVWFSRRGEPGFTRRREGVLGADGTFRTSWHASDEHTFYAVSMGRTSSRVTTRVTGGASSLGTPVDAPSLRVTAPAGVDAGRPLGVVVTGTAGAPVAVWFKQRGEAVFTSRRDGHLDAAGRYVTSYAGTDDVELFATSGAVSSVDVGTVVRPVVVAPAAAVLGGRVPVSGRARPGDTVVVEQRRRAGGAVTRTTTRATSTGAFATSVVLGDETSYRPLVGSRAGGWTTTKVTPTVVGPASAGRGSSVAVTGTARPGAAVEVLFRPRGASGFTVGRRLVADGKGRWSTRFGLKVPHTYYARADGLSSAQRTTAVR